MSGNKQDEFRRLQDAVKKNRERTAELLRRVRDVKKPAGSPKKSGDR